MSDLPKGIFHDIRDTYEKLITQGKLGAFVWKDDGGGAFLDIGTPQAYLEAHRLCAQEGCHRFGFSPAESEILYAEGFGFADGRAILGAGCRIVESVVLAGARVAAGSEIQGSIVGPEVSVRGAIKGRLVTTSGEREIAP